MQVRRRRMRQPRIVERRGMLGWVLRRQRRRHVVLAHKTAPHMAGADAKLEHHRRVGRLRQREALFHHPRHMREIGPRIEQDQRRFQRKRAGSLLHHARALAVVLADDDQRAADHARRREIGERVGCDIGADDRFPGHGTAQRVMDGCAQHGRRRRLVGAGFDPHAEFGEVVLRLHQNVHQMRHRRTLVAADVCDARLQQRLGDGEYALATKDLAFALSQCLHFPRERNFHAAPSTYARYRANLFLAVFLVHVTLLICIMNTMNMDTTSPSTCFAACLRRTRGLELMGGRIGGIGEQSSRDPS